MDIHHTTTAPYSIDETVNSSSNYYYDHCVKNEEVLPYSYSEVMIITVIVPILMVLGLITNGAFLFVVLQIKSMHTITNRYLSSLAIADIAYLILRNLNYLIPYISVPMFQSEEYLGDGGCVIFPLLMDVTFFVHVVMVTIVSLDRFYAVYKPQENRFRYTRKYSRAIIICSWLMCFALAGIFQIPSSGKLQRFYFCDDWSLHNKSTSYPNWYAQCIPNNHEFSSVALICMTFPFFISMIANFFLYSWIIVLLNRRAGSTEVAKKSNQQTRNRITVMLIVTGTLFFLLLIPYEASLLISQSCYVLEYYEFVLTHGWNVWYEFCKILVCILHTINPIIYNATNRRYREAFARAFCLHDIIYRGQSPPGSSYKHPSAIQTTDVTGMDPSNAHNEVVKLHCFDGPSCKGSQDDLESSAD